ncbi:cation-transporting P-type ATPase [Actinomycetaceae bacterium L2_0104]
MSVTSIESASANSSRESGDTAAETNSTETAFIESPHSTSTDSVLAELETSSENGLSPDEAKKRLESVGPNALPEPPKPNVVLRFLSHFNDILIYILLVAAAITGIMGHFVDTIVIAIVAVINATIGFVQEGRAAAALEGLRDMLSPHATAMRDGDWTDIEADELVPGDIVRLRSGDQIPADARLISTSSLRVEESALTGESEPTDKSEESVEEDADLGDRSSMVFSGSFVSGGSGIGVVTATGTHTEIGKISSMLDEVETLETPLTRQMNQLGKYLTFIILIAAVVLFGIGYFIQGSDLMEMFQAAISFAVGAVPEGLPAILSITLARGVQLMVRRNAITRKLNSIETLGSVSVICSDKTGTLTTNEMTARAVVTPDQRYDVEGTGYEPEGEISSDGTAVDPKGHEDLWALVESVRIANETELRQDDDGAWQISGEPTEGALVALAEKSGFDNGNYERLDDLPFDSDVKYMAVLAETPDHKRRIFLKGAPDRLFDLCTDVDREHWEKVVDELSREGLRVLAAAVRDADGDEIGDDPGKGFTFLGVVGILDPPRPEAIEAIRLCRQAGIRVKMITGDHAGTAEAIGRELELDEEIRSITGSEIEKLSDEELQEVAQDHNVFARTSPAHKLRLVKALQARDEVVAMTGDGVNDAPALRRADVGVAMGIKGTEVTKEAAEVVLTDDNFSSIEKAVEEGRTIYDNLRKSILFILPTNGGESLVIIFAIVLGLTLPLSPLEILWVNLVVSVTLALALAFEKSEPGVMDRPPRDPNGSMLDGLFLWRVIFVSVLIGGATLGVFAYQMANDAPLELARTLTVNILVICQAFYLFNVRVLGRFSLTPSIVFSNWVAWASVAALVVLQLVFTYAPFMHSWFDSAPLEWHHWALCVGIGIAVMLLVEIEKLIVRRISKR